ncbi:MAG: Spore germination protein YaaH [Chloroflexi bacterium ADurb.Bin180]|nr:MAG: Spore germination protein YaaH [Chloroflexi bacterium ADurb.Bin180]
MKERLIQTLKQWLQHPQADRVTYGISAVLLIVSLLLPPVSAGTRLLHLDYPVISGNGGAISAADGSHLVIPAGALSSQLRLKIASVASPDFVDGKGDGAENAAAKALKAAAVTLQSSVYHFLAYGPQPKEATFTLPLPARLDGSLADAYSWNGKKWEWTPSEVIAEDKAVEVRLSSLPSMIAVVQAKRSSPAVATTIGHEEELPVMAKGLITELDLEGYSVNADGSISDSMGPNRVTPQGYSLVALVSNLKDGQPQGSVLNAVLLDPKARTRHVSALSALVVEKKYTGVLLDYRGLVPELKDEFGSFVAELATSFHKQGKTLAVRVETPRQISEEAWDTGSFDWNAIGQRADTVVLPAIESPTAFVAGGQMQSLLRWAVGQVDRTKLQLEMSVYGYQIINGVVSRVPYDVALWDVAHLAVAGDKQMVGGGEAVALVLPSLEGTGGLRFDDKVNACWFSHEGEEGHEHQVWLENAASLATKLQLVLDYNLRGVTLNNFLDPQNDDRVWDLLQYLKDLTIPALESNYTVVWTVKGPSGEQSTSCSLLSSGDLSVSSATTGGAAFVWQAPNAPGEYSIAALISDDGGRTTVSQSSSVAIEIPTPTPTSTPTPTPLPTATATPKPTPKPAAAVPAASRGPGFSYGIQGHALGTDVGVVFNMVSELRMSWFKQQVEWLTYNTAEGQYNFGPLYPIVDAANARGIKLLFSVVKAPRWARPPEDSMEGPPSKDKYYLYGDFLRALATEFKGRVHAYEIWNEQNFDREWGGCGKLSAADYVALLKVAYKAIKEADPAAIVVSGAPTPVGFTSGCNIDDVVYLEQMYQAGLKNYCDAVGVHPSGFNKPPTAKLGYFNAAEPSFSENRQFYFRETMERYRNVMVVYGDSTKRLWPTEFGWAVVGDLGVPPAQTYEYAADNTPEEQADFTMEAYRMAKNWGWVGPMFLWNLNFATCNPATDEKSAWSIVRPDWSRRPLYDRLVSRSN